jgi:hypothetical protein
MTPIEIVHNHWTHTCLLAPGRWGRPTKLELKDVAKCIYCSQPCPEEQAKLDALAAKKLVDTKPLKPKGGSR